MYIPVPVTIDRIRNRVNGLKTVYEGSVRNRPGVQLNSMVYNCKDQPTLPRQDSKPGTTHHYRRNEVHTHHIHGANHRYTISTTETTSKGPSSSREIQVPPRSCKHCTNYRAETKALKQAATLIKDSLKPCSTPVFLIDALSVSEALQTNKHPLLATQIQKRQRMQSSSPIDPSTLRYPWQRTSGSASQMRCTRRATINRHVLPGKDHHHQNSAETQT